MIGVLNGRDNAHGSEGISDRTKNLIKIKLRYENIAVDDLADIVNWIRTERHGNSVKAHSYSTVGVSCNVTNALEYSYN